MIDKAFIHQLAVASFKNNELDQKAIDRIVPLLAKKELKQYIKVLKNIEKSNTITVDVPRSDATLEKQLREAFPNKKVQIAIDPSLLLGMKIQDGDDVYEVSLKQTLSAMAKYVTE